MVTFVVWTFTNQNKYSALTLLVVNTMITVDLLALMYFWEISLNAISLVNIVMVSRTMQNCITHVLILIIKVNRNNG